MQNYNIPNPVLYLLSLFSNFLATLGVKKFYLFVHHEQQITNSMINKLRSLYHLIAFSVAEPRGIIRVMFVAGLTDVIVVFF